MAELEPVAIALTEGGARLARRLRLECHGLSARVIDADAAFDDAMAHIASLFAAGRPIIGVCAAGILIRAIAPLLGDKQTEPPVIAISENGAHVVPLLGGHHGGNRLARMLAASLRENGLTSEAAITTSGDTVLGIALDELPQGWALANPEHAKSVTAELLAGGGADIDAALNWLPQVPRGESVRLEATSAPVEGGERHLVYHQQRFAIGIGCARNCPVDELRDLVVAALREAHISPNAVAAIGTIDLKADEPAILALADEMARPLRLFTPVELEHQTPRLANPSDVVFAEVGSHGVSEAAALALAGESGELHTTKRKSANATCAIAISHASIAEHPGRKPGSLHIVGIGPGKPAWRTPEASRAIATVDELVGYGLYLDLLGPLAARKPAHRFPLGEETERCRFALERAGEGKAVALISSGDAGIYAMASLVFELLDAGTTLSDAARRVAVDVCPGISALQAAAARAGAPLGHDFCAISLSDLMTPWPVIERRIEAAAQGDFVIAFYNPVSLRRRHQLARARELLLGQRPPETPVLLAANLGRPQETMVYRSLSELQVDEVDMLTTVLVGSSQSRLFRRGQGPVLYTPRGYADRSLALGGAS